MSFIRTGIDRSQGSGIAAPATIRSEGARLVRAGSIPLVDASVLIAASEFGFAAREGIQLDLVKDVSWANIRDRLAFRQFDIAHMLAPMPVASALGLGSTPPPSSHRSPLAAAAMQLHFQCSFIAAAKQKQNLAGGKMP